MEGCSWEDSIDYRTGPISGAHFRTRIEGDLICSGEETDPYCYGDGQRVKLCGLELEFDDTEPEIQPWWLR
ncbi:MAG TPA: hypothetical protein VKU02_29405 [Gemmataceae bacterium]|nr:hypothetical protein [Gemmataceae bacterium]